MITVDKFNKIDIDIDENGIGFNAFSQSMLSIEIDHYIDQLMSVVF